MPIKVKDTIYERVHYTKESSFEQDVVNNADDIFGDKTIYIDIKKKVKGNNISVIPDGYLIDLTIPVDPKMFVVENEIASHDAFRHIGIQLLKFATTFDDDRVLIRNLIMENIYNSHELRRRLEEGCSQSEFRNIDQYLDKAVYGDFRALVIIDDAKDELHNVLRKIAAEISVIEFKAYKSVNGDYVYEFDTLYEEEFDSIEKITATAPDSTQEARQRRINKMASSDTIIVPAREEGFKKEFIGNKRWFAVRIGAAMKNKIKYIATYQVAPISAITHIGEVQEIRPWQDSGKYELLLKGDPKKINPIPLKDGRKSPQSHTYARKEDLLQAKSFEEAIRG